MKTIPLLFGLLAGVAATGARAESVAALIGDDTIAMIDTSAKKVTKTMKVTGATGKVVGIDVRPADGALYAVSSDGHIWTVDPMSARATMKSKLDVALPAGATFAVDFNPAADRLRIIGTEGTNLRVNVDDGKVTTDGRLKFAETDMHKGEKPMIVAAAYVNSVKGAKETTLYDIDATIGALFKQAPPNDGVLTAVGKLGVAGKVYAFDIATDAAGVNSAWLVADGALHKVDLATGKAMMVASIAGAGSNIKDIAVLPKM